MTSEDRKWVARVKARCRELGLNQGDLAPALGKQTHSAVSHYLSGRQQITVKQLYAIAARLKTSVVWLLEGVDGSPVTIDTDAFTAAAGLVEEAVDRIGQDIPRDVRTAAVTFAYDEIISGQQPTVDSITSMIRHFIKATNRA